MRLQEGIHLLRGFVHLVHVGGSGIASTYSNNLLPWAAAEFLGADLVQTCLDVVAVHAVETRLEAGDSLQRFVDIELVVLDADRVLVVGRIQRPFVALEVFEGQRVVAIVCRTLVAAVVQAEEEEVGGSRGPAQAEVGTCCIAGLHVVLANGECEGTLGAI